MIKALGSSPISTLTAAGMSEFTSVLRGGPSRALSDDPNRFSKAYTTTRGILINSDYLEDSPIDLNKGYVFQFNPQTVTDTKGADYETRKYTMMSFVDYVWGGGGERIITFQLFLDNTPASKTATFRPTAYGSKLAKEVDVENSPKFKYDTNGRIVGIEASRSKFGDSFKAEVESLKRTVTPTKGPSNWEYTGDAYSTTRVHERGILPEVELLQSFLYTAPRAGDTTPKFAEGGIVNMTQFRPPATVTLALGPLYLEGVIKSAPVTYTLFDTDLTPIRATVDIEFAVFEHRELDRLISWTSR